LTNAGGVTVSYFEWVQNLQQFKWTEDEVNNKLEEKMVHAFNEVYSIKKDKSVPMRIASFMVAIDRVHGAYNLREG
jgi:glutamate dehydrogenase